ncbi:MULTISPECIES: tRNA (guanosine(46)-N7)-methyltransferase TrmB [Pseudothermotoga]|jgi:tRNA (guanine-N7-)-methyltransferase|uniref:tRNA (guanine-N(7)-)-methyltransferase n=1 Tax=Pseudothermotoga lettingae (strain ATCC BAA-301 / DSM 14385 / NBRC 107922 / TMO) TaxID=416591 RepID=A8F344_PSELT|nr:MULTISPECIES: tRNA (guanosine(46)-N7)-methyltransferase TrmB [Pseudothermotoga]ABV32576.1 tRNA (guanine-N(7)-)-methyltransferase [Pseudothermotoga lettingae TMO]MDI3494806.1 tRNA (guanine-N7-)-methyltransferase [Pseudothermotoga sp.]MDK2883438.1 tRNA (guanine-N7-)-methyltransferase [Pseudothermotoga sp.]GLI48438.1 tRNA (guanine-N(7)-)-methyltransferase [Pseudothermotoga lettingae TMO]HBJ80843.1 tRNA (guanosine(46)-N7)-methyltransferase TrmB [Pseudothermotoga sp.]
MSEFLRYDLDLRHYAAPIDWKKIFGNNKELAVEIGFGNGEFLVSMAKEKSWCNFIGFETSLISLVKIQKKLYSESIENVKVSRIDGKFALREFFSDNSVWEVYINFPCPWPKKSHQGKRFTDQGFTETLAAVLKADGNFQLISDVKWYVEHMKAFLLKTGCFEIIEFGKSDKTIVGTRYEKKWISQGKDIYILRAKKINHITVERWTWGGFEMPHVHIENVNREKILGLKDTIFKHLKGVFVVKSVYYSQDEYLLRIVSNEGGFQQRYFISVEKVHDRWLVKLDTDASAYRTPVVKFSVRKIAEVIGF